MIKMETDKIMDDTNTNSQVRSIYYLNVIVVWCCCVMCILWILMQETCTNALFADEVVYMNVAIESLHQFGIGFFFFSQISIKEKSYMWFSLFSFQYMTLYTFVIAMITINNVWLLLVIGDWCCWKDSNQNYIGSICEFYKNAFQIWNMICYT